MNVAMVMLRRPFFRWNISSYYVTQARELRFVGPYHLSKFSTGSAPFSTVCRLYSILCLIEMEVDLQPRVLAALTRSIPKLQNTEWLSAGMYNKEMRQIKDAELPYSLRRFRDSLYDHHLE